LKSAVGATEVIVVRAPADDVDLRCGGHPMVTTANNAPPGLTRRSEHSSGTAIGKRYADDPQGLELLCTKGGECSLSVGTAPLQVKEAKPLPSSD
jgi:hypothetical protein